MNPYSQTLAQARLDALQALQDALAEAETPDEKRRCAVAIFNAPDPCDLDDTIDWDDVEDNEQDDADTESDAQDQDTLNDAGNQTRATGSPALRGQPVHACNNTVISPDVVPAPDNAHETTPTSHPNSFPDYPELAHLTDDQILHAPSQDLMQLMVAARLPDFPTSTSSDAAPGP